MEIRLEEDNKIRFEFVDDFIVIRNNFSVGKEVNMYMGWASVAQSKPAILFSLVRYLWLHGWGQFLEARRKAIWWWIGYHGLFQLNWWIKTRLGNRHMNDKEMWHILLRRKGCWNCSYIKSDEYIMIDDMNDPHCAVCGNKIVIGSPHQYETYD